MIASPRHKLLMIACAAALLLSACGQDEPGTARPGENNTAGTNNTTGGTNNATGGTNNTTGGTNNTTGGTNNTTGGTNNTSAACTPGASGCPCPGPSLSGEGFTLCARLAPSHTSHVEVGRGEGYALERTATNRAAQRVASGEGYTLSPLPR